MAESTIRSASGITAISAISRLLAGRSLYNYTGYGNYCWRQVWTPSGWQCVDAALASMDFPTSGAQILPAPFWQPARVLDLLRVTSPQSWKCKFGKRNPMTDIAAAQPAQSIDDLIEALLAENLNAIQNSREIPVFSIQPLCKGIRKYITWVLSIPSAFVSIPLFLPTCGLDFLLTTFLRYPFAPFRSIWRGDIEVLIVVEIRWLTEWLLIAGMRSVAGTVFAQISEDRLRDRLIPEYALGYSVSAETEEKVKRFLDIYENSWKPRILIAASPILPLILWPLNPIITKAGEFIHHQLGLTAIWSLKTDTFDIFISTVFLVAFLILKVMTSIFIKIRLTIADTKIHAIRREIDRKLFKENSVFMQIDLLLAFSKLSAVSISVFLFLLLLSALLLLICYWRRRALGVL
jgi:hypothetical protein